MPKLIREYSIYVLDDGKECCFIELPARAKTKRPRGPDTLGMGTMFVSRVALLELETGELVEEYVARIDRNNKHYQPVGRGWKSTSVRDGRVIYQRPKPMDRRQLFESITDWIDKGTCGSV